MYNCKRNCTSVMFHPRNTRIKQPFATCCSTAPSNVWSVSKASSNVHISGQLKGYYFPSKEFSGSIFPGDKNSRIKICIVLCKLGKVSYTLTYLRNNNTMTTMMMMMMTTTPTPPTQPAIMALLMSAIEGYSYTPIVCEYGELLVKTCVQ